MPFISVRSQPGFYLPGCVHKSKEKTTDLKSYLESDGLRDLRKEYSDPNAEFNKGCWKCKTAEAANQPSYRTKLNEKYKDHGLDKIIYYDAHPGNICNLRCIMCVPANSSAIGAEYKQIGWVDDYQMTDYSDRVIADLENLPDLIEISLIGGEFFLTKKNAEILQYCIDKNIAVTIFTNGTTINESLLNLLTKVKNLTLQFSVDGFEETYELIRYPSNWEDWKATTSKIIDRLSKKAKMKFYCVLQPLNIQNFVQLLDHNNRSRLQTDTIWIAEPVWLGWSILTSEERAALIKQVESQMSLYTITTQQRKYIAGVLEALPKVEFNENNRRLFVTKMRTLLNHRRIPVIVIRKQFGLLEDLCNEVINEEV
jgi:organic radical activating enzyme